MDRYDHRVTDTAVRVNRQCVYGQNQEEKPEWVVVADENDSMLGKRCLMDHYIRFQNVEYMAEDDEVQWKSSPARLVIMTDDADKKIEVHLDHNGMSLTWPGHSEGMIVQATTDDARYILTVAIPEMLERFLEKNTKYARAQVHDLGVKGIVPDVNRKTSVIIDRLWHGAHVVGEGTEEVIDDLIGHLLLMRAKMRSM